jgi:hypothetical protein
LEEHLPLSAIRKFLFKIFSAFSHIGGLPSIRNLRTRHAVMIGTHLSPYIIRVIKYRSIRWAGLEALYGEERCIEGFGGIP